MNVFYVPCFVFLLSMTLVPSMIVLYNAILVEAKAFSNDKELFERVNSGEDERELLSLSRKDVWFESNS